MKFYPFKKRGAEELLAMLKGGHKKFWGSFYPVVRSFSHIEGGRKMFPLFKKGPQKVLPCLDGGAQKVSDTHFSHFVAPPPTHN